MSILRNFTLGGSKSLQFRLEAFNTFNQPVWQDPNTAVTSAQYGQITSTRKPMRELQLGVKFASSSRGRLNRRGTEVLPKGRASVLFFYASFRRMKHFR